MIRFLLDTDFCIALMRGKGTAAFQKLRALPLDEAGIPTITLAELQSAPPDFSLSRYAGRGPGVRAVHTS